MIKVYYLRRLKDTTTNTEYIKGHEYISHAICEATEKPDVRRVIIEENPNLAMLAMKIEESTRQDLNNYKTLPELGCPSRDLVAEIDALKARVEKLET